MSFFDEFRRRKVFRVALAYAAGSWLLIQIVTSIEGPLGLPAWFDTLVIVLLAVGFPIAVVLAWAYEITPEGIKRTSNAASADGMAHVRSQRLNYIVIATLLAAVVLMAIDGYVMTDDRSRTTADLPANSAAIDAAADSSTVDDAITIAVLPFETFADDPEQRAFADGLTEELLNSLAQLDRLRVTARTSSFAFKDSSQTVREIADVLSVDHVLEGSVRKSGNTIRITAQLILARDESHLWSETFDRDLRDIFAIQEEIARAVAEVLEITLGVGDLGRRPGMTRNLEAYELYLLALQQPNFFLDTERSLRSGVALLERAISIDAEFALAWLAMSRMYFQAVPFVTGTASSDWPQNATRALEQALEIAPDSVEIRAYAANQALQQGEWAESLRLLSGLLDSSSSGAFASLVQSVYGLFLKTTGSPVQAARALERARILDPLDGSTALQLGDTYMVLRDFDASIAEFDRGLAMDMTPRPLLIGSSLLAALASGDRNLIEERLAIMATSPDPTRDFNLAMGESLDDPQSALARIRRTTDDDTPSSLTLIVAANWAAYFGDATLALELLRRIPLPVENWVAANTIWRPDLSEVRALPGFRELVADMNLVEFWRESGWPEMCKPAGGAEFVCE